MNRQRLHPSRTSWHITWGTYGARLHGGDRPTVERKQNSPGTSFVDPNPLREEYERQSVPGEALYLTLDQRVFVETIVPGICERGGWTFRTCAASREERDHVHVLCDAPTNVHGRQIRELLKRWATQALNDKFGRPPVGRWWAKGGSTRAIKDEEYLNNAFNYIVKQRSTHE